MKVARQGKECTQALLTDDLGVPVLRRITILDITVISAGGDDDATERGFELRGREGKVTVVDYL
jgi:hypothetical protein